MNEQLGTYFHRKFGVDFRCLRYPGVVASKNQVFNGTLGYATEIFYDALKNRHYTHYLTPDTETQLIYMDDAINGTLQLIQADRSNLNRCVYNLKGQTVTPA